MYANATSILLGLVVEKIFDKPLDEVGDGYFFKPLKMVRTLFKPLDKFEAGDIAPTEIQEWRGGLIQGEIHDESAYSLSKMRTVGSAGLFSTVPDLLNFLEMLNNEGALNGKKYFSPEIIKEMSSNQLALIGESAGLGWELNQPRFMGKYSSALFGKTGFTGCLVLCDIAKGIAMAMLSNTVYPKRKNNADAINEVRRDIANIIFGA